MPRPEKVIGVSGFGTPEEQEYNNGRKDGHNTNHDLHTEWFKSEEFKEKIAKMLKKYCKFCVKNRCWCTKVLAEFISKELGGEG